MANPNSVVSDLHGELASAIIHGDEVIAPYFPNDRLPEQLELIIGAMFSGKSSELIRLMRRFKHAGKKTFLIKWAKDRRFTDSATHVVTHDEDTKEEALELHDLSELTEDKLKEIEVLGIDEGQFFPWLSVYVSSWIKKFPRLTILIAALGATSQKLPWKAPYSNIWDLAPIASKIHHKTGICFFCKFDGASCSARLVPIAGVMKIGGSEMYKCACGKCHEKHNVA